MRKKRSRRYLALASVLGIAYLFLFPFPCGKEAYFKPVWAKAIPGRSGEGAAEDGSLFWFRAGKQFGYARLNGSLAYTGEVLYGVALSDAGFINYPKVAENFVFLDPRGELQYSLRGFGYPVLEPTGEFLYSVSTDLTELRRLDRDGETVWSAGFFCPITSLLLRGEECVAGLLDGTLKILDGQGAILQEVAPEGSRIPVILGVARSPDGHLLAVLSGIDPQRLTLLRRRGSRFVRELVLDMASDFRRETAMSFTADGLFLAVEAPGGLSLLELSGGRAAELRLPGPLLSISSSESGIMAVGCRSGTGAALELLRPLSSPLYSGPLAAQELFLRFVGSSLLIGYPGRLLRVEAAEG